MHITIQWYAMEIMKQGSEIDTSIRKQGCYFQRFKSYHSVLDFEKNEYILFLTNLAG